MLRLHELKRLSSFLETNIDDLELRVELCLDSRNIRKHQAFLAIKGERFNAINFAKSAIENGCRLVIFDESEQENKEQASKFVDKSSWIKVTNTLEFFQDYARLVCEKIQDKGGNVIAISGSNGKTTTRQMLYHLLSSCDSKVVTTEKNNNNHIGVPLTIANCTEDTTDLVLELGSNHPGEIQTHCEVAKPNLAVATNIGATHLEFFGSEKEVFDEEGYVFHWIESYEKAKKIFINQDDNYLKTLKTGKAIYFGKTGEDFSFDFSVNSVLVKGEKEYLLKNEHITGEHNFYNLALAFIMALQIHPERVESYLDAATSFKPTENRSEWLKLKDTKIFLDAYNANPSSMLAALKSFEQVSKSSRMVILGDMNELGSETETYHKEIARSVSQMNFDKVIYIGQYSTYYSSGASGDFECYESLDDFKDKFQREYSQFSYVFIKGSRSLQLERLTDIT